MATSGIVGSDDVERALPQVAGEREHVGLVHQGEVLAAAAARGELERVADAPLDTEPGVHRALGGHLVRRALAQHTALADVRTLGVLADHDEVVRSLSPGARTDERSLVDVQVELEAHLQQQATLDHARRNAGRADGAEQDGVEPAQLVQRRVAEDLAVAQVAGAAEVEVGGVDRRRPRRGRP